MLKLTLAAAVGLATTLSANVALAQASSCAPRDVIVGRLADKYGETRKSMGLNQNNGVVEVFASSETGTWTILVTMPSGMSCLMAAGQNWEGSDKETEATALKKRGKDA